MGLVGGVVGSDSGCLIILYQQPTVEMFSLNLCVLFYSIDVFISGRDVALIMAEFGNFSTAITRLI